MPTPLRQSAFDNAVGNLLLTTLDSLSLEMTRFPTERSESTTMDRLWALAEIPGRAWNNDKVGGSEKTTVTTPFSMMILTAMRTAKAMARAAVRGSLGGISPFHSLRVGTLAMFFLLAYTCWASQLIPHVPPKDASGYLTNLWSSSSNAVPSSTSIYRPGAHHGHQQHLHLDDE